jgi:phosphoenolpyruvate-protein phosphotransferase (PTS system enzyme I)
MDHPLDIKADAAAARSMRMSFTMHGIGASDGVAIGPAHLVSYATLEVAQYLVPSEELENERQRFTAALASVRNELTELRASIPAAAPQEFGAFIDVHQMILADATLSLAPLDLIGSQQCNAEWALKLQLDQLLEQFDAIDDPYLRERKGDILQVVERVMKVLSGKPGYIPRALPGSARAILVAHDLSPADMIQFKQLPFAGFLTDLGGSTSHTAIVARSLAIPAIVALHRARDLIRENDQLIIDGTLGVVIVNPDPAVLAEYRLRQEALGIERAKLQRLASTPAATLDGVPIELLGNIEGPDDVGEVRHNGGMGIGLFRTEFLFMNRDELPDEDEQFEAYRAVAQAMDGLPVTIRTLDIGADKTLRGDAERSSANPALGLRAIRYCLADPPLFHTQLRALLRASAFGTLNILVPMLSTRHELAQTLTAVARARASLEQEGVRLPARVAIGGMVEIPATAIALDVFLKHLDFLSIGTNDLIQYTLAIDRTDDAVAHLYDPLHPAIISLIAGVARRAARARIPVAVCGEMAGDLDLTRLLIGLGLRQLSMHPAFLLEVKQRILKTQLSGIGALARRIANTSDPDRVRRLVDKLNG